MRMLRVGSYVSLALVLGATLGGCPETDPIPVDPTEGVDPSETPTDPGSLDDTPTRAPTPEVSPTEPAASPTQDPSPTAPPTQDPSPTASPTQAPSPTASPTQAPSPTASPTQAPSPTAIPTPSLPGETPSPTATPDTPTPRDITPIPDTPTPATPTPREITPTPGTPTPTVTAIPDRDGDGSAADVDCDDRDPAVYPGAAEVCNGIDDDCDGLTDDGDDDVTGGVATYPDGDGDGYGDSGAAPVTACLAPEGRVADNTDCDDGDAAYNPDAPEDDCADPSDYNCDGVTAYADGDGDGAPACEDCDDGDGAVFPGAPEICNLKDDNCDGALDAADPLVEDADTYYRDSDGDGYGDPAAQTLACAAPEGFVSNDGDCDDGDADLSPETTWYIDFDGDGYGADSGFNEVQCDQPRGYVLSDDDCDDTDPAYNPAAIEDDCADPSDYNCDGSVGFVDGDDDGFAACEDCDDEDAAINPSADETCNGADDDCDGAVDDADPDLIDAETFFADTDGDGFGDADAPQDACAAPAGYVADASDCDDTDGALSPETLWSIDADGDGYGSAAYTLTQCEAPEGYALTGGDCDDIRDAINPGMPEICNDTDDDCDGLVDDDDPGIDTETWTTFYVDGDGDGYGAPDQSTEACQVPGGYVARGTDCDDTDGGVSPGADEACTGEDTDCDGAVDEGFDVDGDGLADCFDDETCDGVDNDGDGDVDEGFPDTDVDGIPDCLDTETCDGADNDGDLAVDEGFTDTDGDGVADCIEVEECDGVDNDGDFAVDEGLIDGGSECAAPDCLAILRANPGASDGVYFVDPDGTGGSAPFEVYCDMTRDGGGWTRLESAQWSHLFTASNWDALNEGSPLAANYSALSKRALFRDSNGAYVLRLTVGNSGSFTTGPTAHTTVWRQAHDPFTETTDGSDYTYIDGQESTTCGGFNGLHNRYQGYSMTSDPDSTDGTGCWWMQVVPTVNYNGSGYLEGYGGSGNYHQWQALWIQKTVAYERCGDGVDNDEDGVVDEVSLGDEAQCPASDCVGLMNRRPDAESGAYWLDPDGASGEAPFQAYCDLASDGGGWMRLMGAKWGHFFNGSNWDRYQERSPLAESYSILHRRGAFTEPSGRYTLRLTVGNSGSWLNQGRAHSTLWRQGHDPFTATTNGSDYDYIDGEESTTCGGFNGLHDRYQGYSMTSDPDSGDGVSCWWMQVVPTANYNGSGYLEGYGGSGNYHQWQSLWIRLPRAVERCGNGVDDDGDGAVDEVAPGELPQCAASDCDALYALDASTPSGAYWIDPDGAGGAEPFKAYCEMVPGEGGWTRLESAHWAHLFSTSNWADHGGPDPRARNYSALEHLPGFAEADGTFTFRFRVGNSGDWRDASAAHTTVWSQRHNPFTETTSGGDYAYISGDQSSTCGGFNGLHDRYQGYSMTSDPDSGDSVGCWWMQVVPTANYNGNGYLEGYGGSGNYHQWQTLWVK